MGFPVVILFLFCLPDLGKLFSFEAPQPFVEIYALSMVQITLFGRSGRITTPRLPSAQLTSLEKFVGINIDALRIGKRTVVPGY